MAKSEQMQKLTNPKGKITIAALDHRGSLQEILGSEEEMRKWKKRMVELYKNEVSGILVDPIYGRELVDKNAHCGWMFSMEKTGYRGEQQARETEISENWSVAQAKESGAAGVKLLLYYDPTNKDLAVRQKEIAKKIAEECQKEEVVFLLEPLSYGKAGMDKPEVVLETARELADLEVDIFKFEYPGDRVSCEEITQIVKKPWVLLSAGMVYDKYREALREAMSAGASGFAVGRAVWQEFGGYQGETRERYFTDVALPRMRELVGIVNNA